MALFGKTWFPSGLQTTPSKISWKLCHLILSIFLLQAHHSWPNVKPHHLLPQVGRLRDRWRLQRRSNPVFTFVLLALRLNANLKVWWMTTTRMESSALMRSPTSGSTSTTGNGNGNKPMAEHQSFIRENTKLAETKVYQIKYTTLLLQVCRPHSSIRLHQVQGRWRGLDAAFPFIFSWK